MWKKMKRFQKAMADMGAWLEAKGDNLQDFGRPIGGKVVKGAGVASFGLGGLFAWRALKGKKRGGK